MRLNRMLRGWLARQLGGAVCALALGVGAAEAGNVGFVRAQGDHFVLNGNTFYFVGTNAYYMAIMTALDSPAHADDQIALAQALGFTVMRMWGYADGPNEGMGSNAFQPSPGVYNEQSFRALDYVLYKADLAGVRLLIPLVDGNSSYGGVNQYLAWCAPRGSERTFYEDPTCKQMYKNYVSYVLNRRNTYNGRLCYRRSTGKWFIRRSSDAGLTQIAWGSPALGDSPVPADYDGDGVADAAVYRAATGEWFIRRSSDGGLTGLPWSSLAHGDTPTPAPFETGGRADIAVYRTTTGEWLIRRSSDGALRAVGWGAPTFADVPLR